LYNFLEKNFFYLIGRFFLLGTRPLILLFFINFNYLNFSNILSEFFLIVSITMIFANFSAHRNYYKGVENNKKISELNELQIRYLQIIFFCLIWGSIFVLFLSFIHKVNIQTYICIFLLFLVEKLHDEIQRYLLLKKKFSLWGKLNVLKSLIFIFSLTMNYFYFGNFKNYFLFAVLNIIGYLVSISFFIDKKKFLESLIIFKKKFVIKNIINNIFKLKILFLITSTSHLALYSERLFISSFYNGILDQVTFVAMICSIMPTFLSIFFIQKKIKEFATNQFEIRDILFNKIFNLSLIGSIVITLIMLNFFMYYQIIVINLFVVYLIFLIQLIYSINMTISEFIFWRNNYKDILFNELFFIIGLSFLFACNIYFNITLINSLICIICLMFVKLILYLHLSKKKNNVN